MDGGGGWPKKKVAAGSEPFERFIDVDSAKWKALEMPQLGVPSWKLDEYHEYLPPPTAQPLKEVSPGLEAKELGPSPQSAQKTVQEDLAGSGDRSNSIHSLDTPWETCFQGIQTVLQWSA